MEFGNEWTAVFIEQPLASAGSAKHDSSQYSRYATSLASQIGAAVNLVMSCQIGKCIIYIC